MVHARPVEQERWLPVVGVPGYDVSDLGRVRSWWKKGRWLSKQSDVARIVSPSVDRYGYKRVVLRRDGVAVGRTVHRMVMESFRGPRPSGKEVAHDDGNPSNCRLDNLIYKTRQGNMADARRHGTIAEGDRNGTAKLANAYAAQIRRRALAGENYGILAREFGVSRATICLIKQGKTYKNAIEDDGAEIAT